MLRQRHPESRSRSRLAAAGRQADRHSTALGMGRVEQNDVRSHSFRRIRGCSEGHGAVKVLVTGGAGFIGSHVAERLVRDGHEVVVFDNESTGLRQNVPPAARYIQGDVALAADLDEAFAPTPDAVCHIAGQVSLIRSYTDASVDLRTNVAGTLNVLQQCLRHRVPRLLYAASMQAYGDTTVLPTPEDAACEPASYYGITKYAAECYVRATAARADLDFAFNV